MGEYSVLPLTQRDYILPWLPSIWRRINNQVTAYFYRLLAVSVKSHIGLLMMGRTTARQGKRLLVGHKSCTANFIIPFCP